MDKPLKSVTHGQCNARPTVTFPAAGHHRRLTGTKLYCLVTEAHVCEQLAQGCYLKAAMSAGCSNRPTYRTTSYIMTFYDVKDTGTYRDYRYRYHTVNTVLRGAGARRVDDTHHLHLSRYPARDTQQPPSHTVLCITDTGATCCTLR